MDDGEGLITALDALFALIGVENVASLPLEATIDVEDLDVTLLKTVNTGTARESNQLIRQRGIFVANSILRPFQKFADEGATIGRLLAGYSTLEIDLMNCVEVAINDFDTVLKRMFRQRGERRRIEEAERLGQAT